MARSEYEERYINDCAPALSKQFGYKNKLDIPRLQKIVINTSLKEAAQDSKVMDVAAKDIAAIAGQKPIITKAKKAISNFKLRAGQPIGCCVTLRRKRMYEFMNKLVNVALPRVRDFRGVSVKSFDGSGNYTLGLTEQIIFPEINPDKVAKVFGMNISFVTTSKTDDECKELLKLMGMPFRR